MLFWNFYITMILETLLEVSFSSTIRFCHFMNKETWWQAANSAFAVIYLTLMLIFAILIPIFLHKNLQKLDTMTFNEKFGALIDMMNTKSKLARIYQFNFLIRRLSFVFIFVALTSYPGAQA